MTSLPQPLTMSNGSGEKQSKVSMTHDTLLAALETHPESGCRTLEIVDGSVLGHNINIQGSNFGSETMEDVGLLNEILVLGTYSFVS